MTDRATRGQLEAAVSRAITRFEQEFRGRGPRQVRAQLVGVELRVDLTGTMTAFEKRCVEVLDAEQGHRVLTELNRQLVDVARPALQAAIQSLTGRRVIDISYEIRTARDEESLTFTLDAPPVIRTKGEPLAAAG